jgi:predicted dehydrogenase
MTPQMTTSTGNRGLKIGIVGAGHAGRALASAFKNSVLAFGPGPALPVLASVWDVDLDRAQVAARDFGIERACEGWHDILSDKNIDAVCIATSHAHREEMALVALSQRKHVFCEIPLSMSAATSGELAKSAQRAGVVAMAGFTYLCNPAQNISRKLLTEDNLGDVTAFRGAFDRQCVYDHDEIALEQLNAHLTSVALDLLGPIARVSAAVRKSRSNFASGSADSLQFLCEFERGGGLGHFVVSCAGTGRGDGLVYEIQGSKGALYFDQDRMNQVEYFRQNDPEELRGYKTIYSGPDQPNYKALYPVPGIAVSHSDQTTFEMREFVNAIATGSPVKVDFAFAYQVDRILEAVKRSVAHRNWVRLDEIE